MGNFFLILRQCEIRLMLNLLLLKLGDYLRARVVLDSLTSIDSTLRSKPKVLHQEKVSYAFYLTIYSKQII